MCGFTLMNNPSGAVVTQVMATKPNVTVTPLPSMIRVDAVSRMICTEEATNMFANPEDAADYLGFDLTQTSA